MFNRITSLFTILCAVLILPNIANAELSIVEGKRDGTSVYLKLDKVKVDNVLEKLGKKYGFTIERINGADRASSISGQFEGSLSSLLKRLLRYENHVIIRSSQTVAGVQRIILLDSKGTNQHLIHRDVGKKKKDSPKVQRPREISVAELAKRAPDSGFGRVLYNNSLRAMEAASIDIPALPEQPFDEEEQYQPAPEISQQALDDMMARHGKQIAAMTQLTALNAKALATSLSQACLGSNCR